MKRIFVIILPLLICLVPMLAWGEIHYVQNGAWEKDWNSSKDINRPTSYTQANGQAAPGDTIIYLNGGGDFTDSIIINPVNSGTAEEPITFKGLDGTTVILDSSTWSVQLHGKSYINIENFTFRNTTGGMWIRMRNATAGTAESHHITIQNNIFESKKAYWAGIYLDGDNSYITIKNNTFYGGIGDVEGHGDLVYFVAGSAEYSIHHCLITDNVFYGGYHVALEFQTGGGTVENNVIRNNTIRNPNHTSFNMYGQAGNGSNSNLIENNSMLDAGSICSPNSCNENVWGSSRDKASGRSTHANFQLFGDSNIIRYNKIFNGGTGLKADQYVYDNKLYNNVFYKNTRGLYLNSSNNISGNNFLNNIFKDNDLNSNEANYSVEVDSLPHSPCANIWGNNMFSESFDIFYHDCNYNYGVKTISYLQSNVPDIWYNNIVSNPLFVNESAYNFNLHPLSPAINVGAALTVVVTNDSGTGTSLIVNDAKYFSDGKGIVNADWIAIGSAKNTVQISSIDYSANTITLANSVARNVGDMVWLYKDSDGTVVLQGSAPDIGAYESPVPLPPENLISIK